MTVELTTKDVGSVLISVDFEFYDRSTLKLGNVLDFEVNRDV